MQGSQRLVDIGQEVPPPEDFLVRQLAVELTAPSLPQVGLDSIQHCLEVGVEGVADDVLGSGQRWGTAICW